LRAPRPAEIAAAVSPDTGRGSPVKIARRAHRVRVPGFRFAGVRAGFKTAGPDVALIVADQPAVVAGVFTTNRAPAAPVQVARRRVAGGRARAVLVHAGNANACTGAHGLVTVEQSTALVGRLLGCDADLVVPCATGRIGFPVDRPRLMDGVRRAVAALGGDRLPLAARAILTTDAFPKTAVRRIRVGGRDVTVAAVGKGGGMIAPDMATLLVFVLTDARLAPATARRVLRDAVGDTLNAITVDGDRSTNDTTLLLASGAAGGAVSPRDLVRFTAAVREVLDEIARLVVLDGEGSTRLVAITVRGARSAGDARRAARAIGESMLCKAAFHGADPNWGRFVMAAGNAGVPLDPERVDVTIGGVTVARRGRPLSGALARARARMRRRDVTIGLDLHLGRGEGRVLAADLSVAYVRFNAEYTT
jgi:glutamate N-acetyltransferase / amino-acid N-acetyltransferase